MGESDPFEEFEFRPLTEGLGFHRKEATSQPAPSSRAQSQNQSFSIPATEITEAGPSVSPTLPRKNKTSSIAPGMRRNLPTINDDDETTTVDEILKTLNERKKYDFTEDQKIRAQLKDAPAIVWRPDRQTFSAVILDTMLITASFLGCLIILLTVTKADLVGNLISVNFASILTSLFVLMGTLTWVYLTTFRVFLGFTPGEWVVDQRVGNPEKVGTAAYTLKVALRSLVVVATGFIVAPIASNFFNTDFLGKLIGLEILRKS
jgi:hypothetical protein